ncbi:protein-disulfide reductase DsbD family protein [Woodsholea maritima]|uniref:protein-disulfide reductase DsbD family protein n=1 Tax=Woodsholea maritima TaxID=240237 RepID=UPI0003656D1C|nr:protein-disulfide reductase DsbD domain-containing protein [Woodsholea maritima]
MLFRVFALISTLFCASGIAHAQGSWNSDPKVEARLISDVTRARPGDEIQIALHQRIEPGWHTYWINPGDSGEPTRQSLDLPEGYHVSDWVWPTPKAYDLGPLTNYGYSDEVVLSQTLTIPMDAPLGPITITGKAYWLVCEEICIPEQSDVSLSLLIDETRVASPDADLIIRFLDKTPQALTAPTTMSWRAGKIILSVADPALADDNARAVETVFFPYEAGIITHDAAQGVGVSEQGLQLHLQPGWKVSGALDQAYGGVLIQSFADGSRKAYALSPTLGDALPLLDGIATTAEVESTSPETSVQWVKSQDQNAAGLTLLQAAFFALLGGLILNLMPCVFPILSMKALNLLHKGHAERSEARTLGLLFGAGVITTFLVLGAGLLGLRAMGLPGLWGFQLQIPVVVAALSVLIFLIGLNFLGFFEIGTSLQGVGQSQSGSGRGGSFLTGVLAVFVAAPCVAPIMTGALVYALTQPIWASLIIFLFLGVGLALPFVIVSFVPQLLAALPKPGAWMVVLRQALAFPMFATAIWLAWVLSVQTGASGTLLILALFLGAALMIWLFRFKGVVARVLAVLALLGLIAGIGLTSRLEPATTSPIEEGYQAWSPEKVSDLRAEGRAVFIDFTAAWCVNCQVNKLTVLSTDAVKTAFAEANVALLRADFTNQDPQIAAALEQYGAAGVPLYVIYPADGGEAEILPALLTQDLVLAAIERAR